MALYQFLQYAGQRIGSIVCQRPLTSKPPSSDLPMNILLQKFNEYVKNQQHQQGGPTNKSSKSGQERTEVRELFRAVTSKFTDRSLNEPFTRSRSISQRPIFLNPLYVNPTSVRHKSGSSKKKKDVKKKPSKKNLKKTKSKKAVKKVKSKSKNPKKKKSKSNVTKKKKKEPTSYTRLLYPKPKSGKQPCPKPCKRKPKPPPPPPPPQCDD